MKAPLWADGQRKEGRGGEFSAATSVSQYDRT